MWNPPGASTQSGRVKSLAQHYKVVCLVAARAIREGRVDQLHIELLSQCARYSMVTEAARMNAQGTITAFTDRCLRFVANSSRKQGSL